MAGFDTDRQSSKSARELDIEYWNNRKTGMRLDLVGEFKRVWRDYRETVARAKAERAATAQNGQPPARL